MDPSASICDGDNAKGPDRDPLVDLCADRHADLAPAVPSLEWNFGDGWRQTFLDAYCAHDLVIDEDLLQLYTRLWKAE